jgi:hypothetical protein
MARAMRHAYGLPSGVGTTLGAALLGESLIFSSALFAMFRSRVVWRGRRFRVGRGGELEPAGEPTGARLGVRAP